MAVALAALAIRVALEWQSGGLAGGSDRIGAYLSKPFQLALLIAVLLGAALAGRKAVVFALRLMLGVIFIYASYNKLFDPQPFANKVENYRLLPRALVNVFTISLVWVEFVTGVLLILGLVTRGAALVSAILYLTFSIAMASALMRGLDIDCGCFTLSTASADADKISWGHVVWRLAGLALSVLVLRVSVPREAPLRAFTHAEDSSETSPA